MSDSSAKKETRPRQQGPDTEQPPSFDHEAISQPRYRRSQAETCVTDVSRNAAEKGEQPYTVWSSERAFILSTAAAGVGLGNLWRFPTLVGENGGGSFLLCYVIAVVFVSVPFAAIEIAAGRRAHGSTLASFGGLGRGMALIGLAIVLLTLMIDSYYFVVSGWTLGYAVEATLGAVPAFETFTSGYASIIYFLITCALVTLVLFFGISGIEQFARVMMPALVLVLLGLAIFALNTGDALQAAEFLFNPDLSQLNDDTVWRAAFGQAFYSLTIGQGYLITYGSYLPRRVNVARSVLSIATINSMVAILAGLAIFPLLFAANLDPTGGSDLAFTALPEAFANQGWGRVLAPIFFWLFFLAAFSSCIGGAKVVTAAIREQISRSGSRLAVLLGLGAIALLGLPSAFSYSALNWQINGLPVLDFVDRTLGTNAVLGLALLSISALAWSLPVELWQRQLGLRTPWLADLIVWLSRCLPLALLLVGALQWV
ncbi:sodium-dependent transporter [Marinospirillum perlucidum]|uniref:sodium-dependent transporter n=1 Tax=Marinospirillum perlucidum TaxID=1982602 RepID=UPI00139060BE|nr:sodium-dependent transporter [Marinospirillum perlucidum]